MGVGVGGRYQYEKNWNYSFIINVSFFGQCSSCCLLRLKPLALADVIRTENVELYLTNLLDHVQGSAGCFFPIHCTPFPACRMGNSFSWRSQCVATPIRWTFFKRPIAAPCRWGKFQNLGNFWIFFNKVSCVIYTSCKPAVMVILKSNSLFWFIIK